METVVLFELSSSPICLQSPWEIEFESSCTPAIYKVKLTVFHLYFLWLLAKFCLFSFNF
uniref:60S ribosomal protein L35aA n=1 Tax=Rhizophora mucronata TaxID=61149 RepID=A0A2P2JDF3_RHIMU